MKITAINIRGFAGLPRASLTVDGSHLLVAGHNGAGKSSVLQAIRFAVTGELARGVKLKRDQSKLITEGHEGRASVSVTLDTAAPTPLTVVRDIESGKTKYEGDASVLEAYGLSLCLDPSIFAGLSADDRRAFLNRLMDVQADEAAIAKELREEGIPEEQLALLLPRLAAGFANAADWCDKQASEARGAWKAITGENYGDSKGGTWTPVPVYAPSIDEQNEATAALRKAEAEANGLNQAIGAASRAITPAKREELTKQAAKLDDLLATQDRGKDQCDALRLSIAQQEKDAKAGQGGTTTPCPHCNEPVLIDRGHLHKPGASLPPEDIAQAAEALARCQQQLQKYEARLADVRADILAAQRAKFELDAAGPEEPADVDTLKADLARRQERIANLRTLVAKHNTDAGAAERAASAEIKAKTAHNDVQAWKRAAAALAPSGIPGRFLARAIKPFNDILRRHADNTGWPQVAIGGDMAITLGGRHYDLCSESECWRADAQIAVAIAELSGCRLVLLDRMDVLDLPGRSEFWSWLLACRGIDGAVVAATLKDKPIGMTAHGVNVVWLDGADTTTHAAEAA